MARQTFCAAVRWFGSLVLAGLFLFLFFCLPFRFLFLHLRKVVRHMCESESDAGESGWRKRRDDLPERRILGISGGRTSAVWQLLAQRETRTPAPVGFCDIQFMAAELTDGVVSLRPFQYGVSISGS
jgi:hypothetical protein